MHVVRTSTRQKQASYRLASRAGKNTHSGVYWLYGLLDDRENIWKQNWTKSWKGHFWPLKFKTLRGHISYLDKFAISRKNNLHSGSYLKKPCKVYVYVVACHPFVNRVKLPDWFHGEQQKMIEEIEKVAQHKEDLITYYFLPSCRLPKLCLLYTSPSPRD